MSKLKEESGSTNKADKKGSAGSGSGTNGKNQSDEWLPETLGAALKIDPKTVSKFILQSKSKSNLVCSVFLPRKQYSNTHGISQTQQSQHQQQQQQQQQQQYILSPRKRSLGPDHGLGERNENSKYRLEHGQVQGKDESTFLTALSELQGPQKGAPPRRDSFYLCGRPIERHASSSLLTKTLSKDSYNAESSDGEDSDGDDEEASLSTCSSASSLDLRILTEADAALCKETGKSEYMDACRELGIFPVSGLVDSLSTTELCLSHQLMSDKALVALCKALKTNTIVEMLDISSNITGEKGANALAELLAARPGLRALSLAKNRMGNDAALILFGGIRKSREAGTFALSYLDLSTNKLTDRSAKGLLSALTCMSSATTQGLISLNLSQNQLGDYGAQAVADILDANRWVLQDLNLGWNVIKSRGAAVLADAAARCVVLQRLVLSWNSIDDHATPALCELIASSNTLRFLDLSHNQLGQSSAELIGEAIKHTSSLRTLEIGFNPLGLEGCERIMHGLRVNESLRYLGVENPTVSFTPRSSHVEKESLDIIWASARKVEEERAAFVDIATEHPRRRKK